MKRHNPTSDAYEKLQDERRFGEAREHEIHQLTIRLRDKNNAIYREVEKDLALHAVEWLTTTL